LTTTTNTGNGAGELADFNDYSAPLIRQLSVRVDAPTYARVLTRALCERSSEGKIIRRWLWKGALAEGIDIRKPL